jgi:hypothetical protein
VSAEATGWVFRHSPYKGAGFVIHLAIADSVNDQNDNEFWMSQARLCEKARTSHATTERAVRALRDDGFLTLLEDNATAGKPCRYRFEMPLGVPHGEGGGPSLGVTQVPHGEGQTQRTTQDIPTSSRALDGFNAFWQLYPRKKAKGAALKAYERAVKRADRDPGQAVWKINTGARDYARERNGKDQTYTAYPATWLNEDRWTDEPEACRPVDSTTANGIRYT